MPETRLCAVCGGPLTGKAVTCSSKCRQKSYRVRQAKRGDCPVTLAPVTPTAVTPPVKLGYRLAQEVPDAA